MQEWKDTQTKQVFTDYKTYVAWIMHNDFIGIRECMITTYEGKDNKWITGMAIALTDCSTIQLLKQALMKHTESLSEQEGEESNED